MVRHHGWYLRFPHLRIPKMMSIYSNQILHGSVEIILDINCIQDCIYYQNFLPMLCWTPRIRINLKKNMYIYIFQLKSFQQNYSLCRNAPWNNHSLLHFLAVRSWPACRWQSIRWNAKAAWVALCSVFSKSRTLSLDTSFEALQI